MARHTYLADLSDEEYAVLAPHLPAPCATGRPRVHAWRELLDAIFYALRSGCAWRLLPREFPPWRTVYHDLRLRHLPISWTSVILPEDHLAKPAHHSTKATLVALPMLTK